MTSCKWPGEVIDFVHAMHGLGAASLRTDLIGSLMHIPQALAAKKRNGERLGASPLGFVTPAPGADLQPELAELEAVRTILRHRRSGKSYYGIARMMNRKEVPTKSGGRWHAGTVRNVWKRRVSYRKVLGG